MSIRHLSTSPRVLSHSNPLGLPTSTGAPPPAWRSRASQQLPQRSAIRGVRRVLAVSSAKGGVGKSTVAASLALSFARQGQRAGILDTDVFGPSIPTLFNLAGQEPRLAADGRLLPLTNYGVKTMSMGYLVPGAKPVAWRGLMVAKALQQLVGSVDWGALDVLVLDLPPGTGDVQLGVVQQVRLDGALLVSTPSRLSVEDTLRGADLFRTVDVPVLGVVLNMASYACASCGEASSVFGPARTEEFADRGIPVLAEVPLDARICGDGDAGMPSVVASPESRGAMVFADLAVRVGHLIGLGTGAHANDG